MAATLSATSRRHLSDLTGDAALCEEILDEGIVAYVAGADSVKEYRQRLTGTEDDRLRIASRLAAARRVILIFDAENCLPLAGPWLREIGATGETPAGLIRDKGDDEKVGAVVAEVAEQWVKRRRRAREARP
jgi:hypothetical protein